jgi:hypothetical protein
MPASAKASRELPARAMLVSDRERSVSVMRHVAVTVAMLLLLGGCAGARASLASSASEAEGYAAPGPDLVGTWQGRVWVLEGTVNEFTSVPVDLTVSPDGTWSWSTKGQVQGRGTVAVHGDRVVLQETWARKGNTQPTNGATEMIQLKHSRGQLWGVTRAFMPNAENAVQLKKIES